MLARLAFTRGIALPIFPKLSDVTFESDRLEYLTEPFPKLVGLCLRDASLTV